MCACTIHTRKKLRRASNSRDEVAKRISDPGLVLFGLVLFGLAGAAREGDPPSGRMRSRFYASQYTCYIYVCMYWHAHSGSLSLSLSLSGLTAVRTQFILIAMARANALRECHIALCIKKRKLHWRLRIEDWNLSAGNRGRIRIED